MDEPVRVSEPGASACAPGDGLTRTHNDATTIPGGARSGLAGVGRSVPRVQPLTRPRRRRKPRLRGRGATPLGAALIGVAAALLAATLTSAVALVAQDDKLEADRAALQRQLTASRGADARTKRAEVYAAFLSAANLYSLRAQQLFEACDGADLCSTTDGELRRNRYAFQGAVNDVYIYGSDEANAVSGLISALLPNTNIGLSNEIELKPIDEDAVAAAYRSMLLRACIEASAEPRQACIDLWDRASQAP
jgi:hypothetical protein